MASPLPESLMYRRLPVVAALLTAAVACTAADDTANVEADVEAIRGLIAQELAAINALDVDGFTAIWADDIMAMPPNEPAVSGEAAVEWLNGFVETFSAAQGAYHDEEIIVSGDWAMHTYGLELTVTPRGGGDAETERGRGIHIFRRGADGSWKMSHDIWNTEAPPEGM